MAQSNKVIQQSAPVKAIDISNLAVAVPQTGNTTLLTIPCHGVKQIMVQVVVSGQALDAFLIQARPTLDAALSTLYSAAADFTAPKGLLIGASGDLTAQAVGTGWFIMDVTGLAEVAVLASSGNVAGSTVSAYCGGA